MREGSPNQETISAALSFEHVVAQQVPERVFHAAGTGLLAFHLFGRFSGTSRWQSMRSARGRYAVAMNAIPGVDTGAERGGSSSRRGRVHRCNQTAAAGGKIQSLAARATQEVAILQWLSEML